MMCWHAVCTDPTSPGQTPTDFPWRNLKCPWRSLKNSAVSWRILQGPLKESLLSIKNSWKKVRCQSRILEGKCGVLKEWFKENAVFWRIFRKFFRVLSELNLAATYINHTSLGLPQNQIKLILGSNWKHYCKFESITTKIVSIRESVTKNKSITKLEK